MPSPFIHKNYIVGISSLVIITRESFWLTSFYEASLIFILNAIFDFVQLSSVTFTVWIFLFNSIHSQSFLFLVMIKIIFAKYIHPESFKYSKSYTLEYSS